MNGNSQTEDYEKLMAELELICDESKQGSSFYDFSESLLLTFSQLVISLTRIG
jgi:hypothetical protein